MKSIKPFLMAMVGTFVEYYDYALYGFSAPLLAQHFFPKEDPLVALMQTYGIFIAGSCAKPLGALIFGFLGDRYGRAFTLKITITGIAIPTLVIGILPSFDDIGYYAPVLLLLCRIFQGIFVSGESDNARVFLYEMFSEKYRCFSNSLAYFVCMMGIYVASLFAGLSLLPSSPYLNIEWMGWAPFRLPFLLGGLLGIFLFIVRRSLQENLSFIQAKQSSTKLKNQQKVSSANKTRNVFQGVFVSKNKYAILITLLLTGALGGQYHFYFVFLNQYLSQILKKTDVLTGAHNTSSLLLCFALLLPLSGFLADHLTTRFKVSLTLLLKYSSCFLLCLAMINLYLISYTTLSLTMMYVTVAALSFTHANTFVVILEQFKVLDRCRGASIGHALGSMIFSGSAPLISLGLWKVTQWEAAPMLYFVALCCISLFGLFLLDRKKHRYEPTFVENFVSQSPI